MFKICLLNNPRLIVITQTFYTLSVKSTIISALLHLPHSLLYISFRCGCRTVCYLEEVSLGMKVVRINLFLLMLPCWRIPTEQADFVTKQSNVICLRKITIHYVLKEVLYKNILSLNIAVTLFMKFLCVISDVKKETWFVSRKNF